MQEVSDLDCELKIRGHGSVTRLCIRRNGEALGLTIGITGERACTDTHDLVLDADTELTVQVLARGFIHSREVADARFPVGLYPSLRSKARCSLRLTVGKWNLWICGATKKLSVFVVVLDHSRPIVASGICEISAAIRFGHDLSRLCDSD